MVLTTPVSAAFVTPMAVDFASALWVFAERTKSVSTARSASTGHVSRAASRQVFVPAPVSAMSRRVVVRNLSDALWMWIAMHRTPATYNPTRASLHVKVPVSAPLDSFVTQTRRFVEGARGWPIVRMRAGPVMRDFVSHRRIASHRRTALKMRFVMWKSACVSGAVMGMTAVLVARCVAHRGCVWKAWKAALKISTVYAVAFVQKVNVLRLAMVTHRVLACRHVMQILAGALKPPMGNASALKIALALESA